MAGINKSPYRILRKPIMTEKTTNVGTLYNCVVFEVHPEATKTEIRNAVERAFSVEIESVRTVNCLGKIKRVSKNIGRQRNTKKAYVSLKPGHTIRMIEGL